MPAASKYPTELKQRAVRLVTQSRAESGRDRGVRTSTRQQLSIPPDRLPGWVQRVEVDDRTRPGMSSDDARRLVELEKEKRGSRQAYAILRKTLAFFAAELDRPHSE
jgi:transposase